MSRDVLDDQMRFGIGVDLGGTNLRVAAISAAGTVLDEMHTPTPSDGGPKRIVGSIVDGIKRVARGQDNGRLAGIGVGVPALTELETGIIRKAPNLPGWEGFNFRKEIQDRLGCPVLLENDANLAALGEFWWGAGRNVEDLILLTLGTGIGGGIISGGKILHGFLGMAGEIGHITVEPGQGALCGCGSSGCLEVHASATAITRMGDDVIRAGRSATLTQLKASQGKMTARLVYEAANSGDPEATRIYERVGVALGRGIATIVTIFNFPLYILGGGVLEAWNLFAPAMLEEIKQRSVTYRHGELFPNDERQRTHIERAELGSQAGLYGAAFLPIQHATQAMSWPQRHVGWDLDRL